MTVAELIDFLSERDPATKVPLGFGPPMSYRGFYEDVAFPVARDTTVGEMLAHAKSALDKYFPGYKGGLYLMTPYAECWLAEWGHTGEGIGPVLLSFMVGEQWPASANPSESASHGEQS